MSSSGGRRVVIDGGVQAFIPDPLPSEFSLPGPTVPKLDDASRAVSVLAGGGETLPNPHLLVTSVVRSEGVLSSRIESTLASPSDLVHESAGASSLHGDVQEVRNYVTAMELGIERLKTLPISVRLVNQLHAALLEGVRGADSRPGQLRDCQVWIGVEGTPIEEA